MAAPPTPRPERTLFDAMLVLHEASTPELVAELRSRVTGGDVPLALARQLAELATQAVTDAGRRLPR